jgi:hypothetical protein
MYAWKATPLARVCVNVWELAPHGKGLVGLEKGGL